MATIDDCKIINLPKEEDPRGSLTYIYQNVQVPFEIRRVFYIYDVPAGKDRGAHAHKQCWQFIIAASGALEVYLNDGHSEKIVTLNRPFQGLLVPPASGLTNRNSPQVLYVWCWPAMITAKTTTSATSTII